jgi:hypothetical protein
MLCTYDSLNSFITHYPSLLCIILLRKAWIFLPDLRCSTLGIAESFTITRLSRPLQGLSGRYYRIYCRVEGSAISMHLKALYRIYLSKPQIWRKEAGHTRKGTQLSSNSSQSLTIIGVSSHCLLPRFDCLEKMYRNCILL